MSRDTRSCHQEAEQYREWPMSEAAAVWLDRSPRLSEHETALEVGWLLAEMEQRFDYSLNELARRFDRSVSWVSRRLALVEVLPESIQQQVREGQVLAQVALRCLVPVARQSLEHCHRMAAIFAEHHCDTRQAGQLYAAWRKGSPVICQRILDEPELFFKAQRQVQEKAPTGTGAELLGDPVPCSSSQRGLVQPSAIGSFLPSAEGHDHRLEDGYREGRCGRAGEDALGGSLRAKAKANANATHPSKISSDSTPRGSTRIIDVIGLPVNSIGRVCGLPSAAFASPGASRK